MQIVQVPSTQQFHFSESFLAPYRKLGDPFKTLLARSTYLSKYCRDKETWTDTIRRVVESNVNLAPAGHVGRAEAEALYHLFWTGQALPPGRSLWVGGIEGIPADARYNCFSKETRFWANGRLVTFEEAVGETVQVLCVDGAWRNAEVHSFGVQHLRRILLKTLCNSNFFFEFVATPNHRWLTSNRGVVDDLRVGDRIQVRPNMVCVNQEDYADGFVHGFVFGDGSKSYLRPDCYQLRLCSAKDKAFQAELEAVSFFRNSSKPPSYAGDPILHFKTARNLKALPVDAESLDYQRGFLNGWLAADGSVRKNGARGNRLNSQNADALRWVTERAPLLGFCVTGWHVLSNMETNLGARSAPLGQLNLVSAPIEYVVRSIADEGRAEEVFCVVEPETQTFTLEGGVPTGNCWMSVLNGIDDWCWTANQLMLGGGVGVSLNNIGSLPTVCSNPCRLAIHCRPDHSNIDEVKPESKDFLNGSTPVFVVADSRDGWVSALRLALTAAFEGKEQIIDVSNVRERGQPIKTFGGIACGPGPLANLLRSVWSVVRSAAGGKLTSLNCLDITNFIGLCIKSGNVRRCLPGDTLVFTEKGLVQIKNVKVGDKVLTSGTKSEKYMPVTAHLNQGVQKIVEIQTQMGILRCTPNHRVAVASPDGEYAFKMASELILGDHMLFLDEPLPGQATVLPPWGCKKPMQSGAKTINIIFPKLDTEVAWALGYTLNNSWIMSRQDMKAMHSDVSYPIPETAQKEKTIARLQSVLVRFGILNSKVRKSIGDRTVVVAAVNQFAWYLDGHFKGKNTPVVVPECILQGTPEIRAAFIAGVFDSSGTSLSEFAWRALCSAPYQSFVRMLQDLCASIGLMTRAKYSTQVKERDSRAVFSLHPVGALALATFNKLVAPYALNAINPLNTYACDYPVQKRVHNKVPVAVLSVTEVPVPVETFDIEVAGAEEFVAGSYLVHNSALIVLGSPEDQDFRDSKKSFDTVLSHRHTSNNTIAFRSWEQIANFDWKTLVADVLQYGEPGIVNMPLIWKTDPEAEGINPCAEIPLSNRESCNLAEVFPAFFESGTNPEQAFELVTRYTLRQRLVPLTDSMSHAVSQKNMRLGVALGGICDFDWDTRMLSNWYTVCRNAADTYARELGVARPIAVTTSKPSGTISLLNGSSPGIHAPFAPYYIRRTRIATNDPMVLPLIEAGVPFEYDVYDKTDNTLVFSFPTKATHTRHTVQTETIREQFERQVAIQEHWSDNSVSCTLSFKPEEKEELSACLKEYVPRLKSTSCLSKSHGYSQAPYEAIDYETYASMVSTIQQDHPLAHGGEMDDGGCSSGVCPLR